MRIISTKRYNELLNKNEELFNKNIQLTLDKSDLADENDLYNTQVNMLMGKCEDLQSKLEKKTTEMKNLKLVLQRNKIDYKALLKEKCPLQKKVEKLSKDLKIK